MSANPEDNLPEQTRKFIELARQLECDEDEKAFEEKVRKVAKTLKAPNSRNKK